MSLRVVTENGHTYTGNQEDVTVFFTTVETLFFQFIGRLDFLYAYRPGMLVVETTKAIIAPGPTPRNRNIHGNINYIHFAHAHVHKGALRKTNKQIGVTLEGELHECKGRSMVKGIDMSIPSRTDNCAGKK